MGLAQLPTHLGLRFPFSNLVSKLVSLSSLSLPHSRRPICLRPTAHPPSPPSAVSATHHRTSPRVGRSRPPVPHTRHRSPSTTLCTSSRAPTSLHRPSSSCSGRRQVRCPGSRSRLRGRISLWPVVLAAWTPSPPVAAPPCPRATPPRTFPTCCTAGSRRAPSPLVAVPP